VISQQPNKPQKPVIFYCVIALIVLSLLNIFLFPSLMGQRQSVEEVSYDVFLDQLDQRTIDKVEVQGSTIYFSLKEGASLAGQTTQTQNSLFSAWYNWMQPRTQIIYSTAAMDDIQLVERLHAAGATFSAVQEADNTLLYGLLINLIPILAFVVVWRFIMKKMGSMGGGAMSFGKSGAKVYVKAQTGITFADVAGQEEAKESLREIVDFLHNPAKYAEIGAKMPKGALLVGPPGTGKTLLAKAVAGEANVPFFSISGSEFVEMFVGMGAAKVRDLFKQAGEKAPCIVFIDEIDTIGKKRDGSGFSGNDEREQTLNQLLAEMDGFDAQKGVVILAATNRPETLDKALLRPGRFDRRIPVELPDLKGREAVLRVHAKDVKTVSNIDYTAIARAASGASGAEMANIVNEGALRAVRAGRNAVTQADLEESIEVILAGQQRKGMAISPKEKELIAYHEVGHALVAACQTDSAPVHKITIIPRTSGALGYTMQVDEKEHYLMSREELFNKIVTLTGGRAAEELMFGAVTTGAANDIEQATKLARAMVTRYGMSRDFGMVALETVTNQYLGGDTALACSAETASKIDDEVIATVQKAHDQAVSILREHMQKLNAIARYLIERETLTGQEFMEMLHAA
jgi:cell division protease FtsH